jgi:Putative bacterial sensory transduction regulator
VTGSNGTASGSGHAEGAEHDPSLVRPALVDAWLAELDVTPRERAERDGITSWDVLLDGRARPSVLVTLILDPALALVCWVHYAPPINESFRISYRMLLRWNDELPFVKFALSEDERPVLSAEVPTSSLSLDSVGLMLARLVAVCDLLLAESVHWLWPGAKAPPIAAGQGRNPALLDRYAAELAELAELASTELSTDDVVAAG